jgi:hypothetical protein
LTRRANQGHFSIDPKSCTPPRAEAVHDSEADEVVLRTIQTILTSFGIEEEDRAGLRADFQHLRRWRRSVEQAPELHLQGDDHGHRLRHPRRCLARAQDRIGEVGTQ